MYSEREYKTLIKKLEALQDKRLLDDCGNVFIIKRWLFKTVIHTLNLPFKSIERKRYVFESLDLLQYNKPTKTMEINIYLNGDPQCTHAEITKMMKWRIKFITMRDQLDMLGYKLTKKVKER